MVSHGGPLVATIGRWQPGLTEDEIRRVEAIANERLAQQAAPSFDINKAFKKIIKLTQELGKTSPFTAVLMSNVYWPEIHIGKDFAYQWQGIKPQTPEFKQLMNDLKKWEQRQPTHVKPSGLKFIQFEEGEEATSIAAQVAPAQEIFLWGLAARQGKRPTMEDDHDNRIMGSQAFFGVYDGHGGANAAKYTTKNLYNNFLKEKGTIRDRLVQAFEKTDQQIQNSMNDGTTAVAAFINGDKAYIANAGDARALIIRNGKIITATKDHKPNDPVEKARIEREDGFVRRGRVGGRLAVARALGDEGIIGVSATPDIYEQTLQNGDIIVLACDGLWDVMTNKQVAQLVHTAVQKQRAETLSAPGRWESVTDDGNADLMGAISRMLRDRAYDAGSRDNISVMVIQIKL